MWIVAMVAKRWWREKRIFEIEISKSFLISKLLHNEFSAFFNWTVLCFEHWKLIWRNIGKMKTLSRLFWIHCLLHCLRSRSKWAQSIIIHPFVGAYTHNGEKLDRLVIIQWPIMCNCGWPISQIEIVLRHLFWLLFDILFFICCRLFRMNVIEANLWPFSHMSNDIDVISHRTWIKFLPFLFLDFIQNLKSQ